MQEMYTADHADQVSGSMAQTSLHSHVKGFINIGLITLMVQVGFVLKDYL